MSIEKSLTVLGLPNTCRNKKEVNKAYLKEIEKKKGNKIATSNLTKAYLEIKEFLYQKSS